MKILNKGRNAHLDLFVGDCKLCGCKVECTREETEFVPKGRFKSYRLKGKCPNPKCTWHIWVDHKKPDKKKGFFARLFNLLSPIY